MANPTVTSTRMPTTLQCNPMRTPAIRPSGIVVFMTTLRGRGFFPIVLCARGDRRRLLAVRELKLSAAGDNEFTGASSPQPRHRRASASGSAFEMLANQRSSGTDDDD